VKLSKGRSNLVVSNKQFMTLFEVSLENTPAFAGQIKLLMHLY